MNILVKILESLRRQSSSLECPDKYKYIVDKFISAGYMVKNYKKGNFLISNDNLSFLVSGDYPWIAFEVFIDDIYNFHSKLDLNKKYTVIDIGANRGYASLYFASKDWCEKVYAFELVPQNYLLAVKNIHANSKVIKDKISLHNFGLANSNANVEALYLSHRDGISSLNNEFIRKFAPEEENKIQRVTCRIKKSSTALRKIQNRSDQLIMKIDVEGSEYDIFKDLALNNVELLKKTRLIIGEAHLGFKKLLDIVKPFGFTPSYKEHLINHNCSLELVRSLE